MHVQSKLLQAPVTCPTAGSCDTVLNSGYASVFGLPLPLLGMRLLSALAVCSLAVCRGLVTRSCAAMPIALRWSRSRAVSWPGCAVYGGVALLAGRQALAQATRARQGAHSLNRTRYAILAGGTVLASTSGYLLYLLATVFAGESCTWCLASAALSAAIFVTAARGFTTQ